MKVLNVRHNTGLASHASCGCRGPAFGRRQQECRFEEASAELCCCSCDVPATGNEAVKQKNFESAVQYYSKAIQLDPTNPVYFCNRYELAPLNFVLPYNLRGL
jgi:hypothetical protein